MPTQGTQAGLRKDLKRVVDDKIPKDVSWQQTTEETNKLPVALDREAMREQKSPPLPLRSHLSTNHLRLALNPSKRNVSGWGEFPFQFSLSGDILDFLGYPTVPTVPMTTISTWLKICSQHHPCQKLQDVLLPTRVLDVQFSHLSQLNLVESKGMKGRYICLSHCWGDALDIRKIQTTPSNINNYMHYIDLDCLTRTFREAVELTRELEVRYLWIDSLCIIQGDTEDWAKESCEMGRIFENAYLVLAAAHAENSSGGLLPVKQFPQMLSATRSEAALRAVHKESVDFVGALPKNDFVDHHGTEQPLLHRAWVYQERFLASRVLFFLKDHVLWECAETIECECTPEGRHIHGWDNNNYYRRLLMGISHDKSEASFRHQWLQTVERYSPLHLTFPTDKLPALSGLAKRFLASKKDEYLAGMWKSTLLEDLAWRVQKPCPSPQPWRAPSWSWVSVDGPVKIPGIKRQNCHAKVIQVYCQPSTSDPTGPVSEGHLVLRSRVIRSLYSTIGIPLCGYRDQPEMTSFYRIYPDFQWSQAGVFTSSGGKFCCLEIGTLDNGMYEVEYFLILKPASFGNDAYERVGLLELHGANGIEEIQMAIRESPFEVVTIK